MKKFCVYFLSIFPYGNAGLYVQSELSDPMIDFLVVIVVTAVAVFVVVVIDNQC